jgi:hypothetical protein
MSQGKMRHTAIFGGNRDETTNSGSRASNWNNPVWNTNWNIGCRYACNRIHNALETLMGYSVRSLLQWLAHFSRVSEYITRFVKGGVVKTKDQDDMAAHYGC